MLEVKLQSVPFFLLDYLSSVLVSGIFLTVCLHFSVGAAAVQLGQSTCAMKSTPHSAIMLSEAWPVYEIIDPNKRSR